MIAKVYSAIPQGYNGELVEVEGDSNQGLPCFNIVGMANKTITEARERVRSALANSNLSFPQRKVTINLAPAELAKDGTHLDLPIALAILVLSQQLLQSDLEHRLFVGELSLDGLTKPVRGIINIVEAAKKAGYTEIYLPEANLQLASLVPEVKLYGVTSLLELVLHLKNAKIIQPYSTHKKCTHPSNYLSTSTVVKNNSSPGTPSSDPNVVKNNIIDIATSHAPVVVKNTITDTTANNSPITDCPRLDDIYGQAFAKRALTIAAAGRHNILFTGPPGTGKTLLARTLANLLPPPTPEELLEIAKLHTIATPLHAPQFSRPFRAPHHTTSSTAIIGGGNHITPGEISLAHCGVLFLDELPEYRRDVLEALRQPLESHSITVTRTKGNVTYPANFMLVATMNPCPCGNLNHPHKACTCTTLQIKNYQNRLSGPILDRIDLVIEVQPINSQALLQFDAEPSEQNVVKNTKTGVETSTHAHAQKCIQQAIARQRTRFDNLRRYNSDLSPAEITRFLRPTPEAIQLLNTACDKFELSTRAYFKIIKVAQTIADLAAAHQILPEHISEALAFREKL